MNAGLVRHDPSSGQDFESLFRNQFLEFRLLIGRRAAPPPRQERHLGPRERHVFVRRLNCYKIIFKIFKHNYIISISKKIIVGFSISKYMKSIHQFIHSIVKNGFRLPFVIVVSSLLPTWNKFSFQLD